MVMPSQNMKKWRNSWPNTKLPRRKVTTTSRIFITRRWQFWWSRLRRCYMTMRITRLIITTYRRRKGRIESVRCRNWANSMHSSKPNTKSQTPKLTSRKTSKRKSRSSSEVKTASYMILVGWWTRTCYRQIGTNWIGRIKVSERLMTI